MLNTSNYMLRHILCNPSMTQPRVASMVPMLLNNHEIPLGDGHKLWTEMLVAFQYRLDDFQEDESEKLNRKAKTQSLQDELRCGTESFANSSSMKI
jgi:hypothetical protein